MENSSGSMAGAEPRCYCGGTLGGPLAPHAPHGLEEYSVAGRSLGAVDEWPESRHGLAPAALSRVSATLGLLVEPAAVAAMRAADVDHDDLLPVLPLIVAGLRRV